MYMSCKPWSVCFNAGAVKRYFSSSMSALSTTTISPVSVFSIFTQHLHGTNIEILKHNRNVTLITDIGELYAFTELVETKDGSIIAKGNCPTLFCRAKSMLFECLIAWGGENRGFIWPVSC